MEFLSNDETVKWLVILFIGFLFFFFLIIGNLAGWFKGFVKGLSKVKVGKEGVSIDREAENKNYSLMFSLKENANKEDKNLNKQAVQHTKNCKQRIKNYLHDYKLCLYGSGYMSGAVLNVLFEYARSDSLVEDLREKDFFHNVLNSIESEWDARWEEQELFSCQNKGIIAEWTKVKADIEKMLFRFWYSPIIKDAVKMHNRKIDSYNTGNTTLAESGDEYKIKINNDCAIKNQGYIKILQEIEAKLRTEILESNNLGGNDHGNH